jgi:hypothetical protein
MRSRVVSLHWSQYDTNIQLPLRVRIALDVQRKGLLCWTSSILSTGVALLLRLLFVALDVVFVFHLLGSELQNRLFIGSASHVPMELQQPQLRWSMIS